MNLTLSFSRVILLLVYMLFISNLFGQEQVDIDDAIQKIKSGTEAEPFKITGNLRTDLRLNYISGLERRVDPFDLRINGHLGVAIYGVKSTLNLNLSEGRIVRRFNRPDVKLPGYALVGWSPTYKWSTAHLGFRALNFSNYSLSGHSFYGAGISLKPRNFRFHGFYGRLKRAVPEILNLPNSIDPSYRRMAWGVKTGYSKNGDELYIISFYAQDDPNSILAPTMRKDLSPASNLVLSSVGQKKINQYLTIKFDYAYSAFTRDIQAETIENRSELSFIYDFGGLYRPKASTGFHKALKTSLNVNTDVANFEIMHERVDPGYRSLGTLFFNNDFENVTIGMDKALLKKKIRISARAGLQRNNLSQTENNTFRRLIGQANVSWQVNPNWNIVAAGSNFSTTNVLRVNQLPLITEDSIILTQINRNFSLTNSLIIGSQKKHILTASFAYQQFNTVVDDTIDFSTSINNFMANIMHSYRFLDNSATITNAALLNNSSTVAGDIITIVPSHTLTNTFLDKKLRMKCTVANAFLFLNTDFSRHILQVRLDGTYEISDRNQVGLAISYVGQSNNQVPSIDSFWETGLRLKHQYRF